MLSTGVDITDKWVVVAQIKRMARTKKRTRKVVKLFYEKLPLPSNTSLCSKNNLNFVSKEVLGCIRSSYVTARTLKFPSTNYKQLRQMVNLYLPEELPYPAEEFIKDFTIIDSDKEGYSYVSLCLVHRDVVESHLTSLESMGLRVQELTLSSEAICDAYFYLDRDAGAKSDYSLCLVNIDHFTTEIIGVHKGRPVHSRYIPLTTTQLMAEGLSRLSDEIKQTISTYEKERFLPPPEKIIIVGPAIFRPIFDSNMDCELPVEFFDPFKETELTPYKDYFEGCDISPLISIGLALIKTDGSKERLNLLPERLMALQKYEIFKKWLFITTGLVGLGLVFSGIILKYVLRHKEAYLADLEDRLEDSSRESEKLWHMKEMLQEIKADSSLEPSMGHSAVTILSSVYKMIPEGMRLYEFDLSNGEQVRLRGDSDDIESVLKLYDNLKKFSLFKDICIKYITARPLNIRDKISNRAIYEFEVQVLVEK